MKKSIVAKRSAASHKGWRTRKRMNQARDEDEWAEIERVTDELLGKPPLVLGLTKPPWEDEQWPTWMRRALPLPKYGT